ncbi:MAG TPA: AAC(3) family N-acetyltransferase [Streptosporangiaceae bacterium]
MTAAQLATGLRRLGLPAGATVLVHSSMRSLGRIPDRPGTLFRALREVLGPGGTTVVPTFTPGNSLTSTMYQAAVEMMPPKERTEYHRAMKPFDPATTPSALGCFSEFVRTAEGAVRSAHPQTSFAAVGGGADSLMARHDLDNKLGERSPLARLYDRRAYILLVGVGYSCCSAFHLAEHRYTAKPPLRAYHAVVLENGRRVWRRFLDVRHDDSDFALIGKHMEQKISVSHDTLVGADIRLCELRAAVDFATGWLRENR